MIEELVVKCTATDKKNADVLLRTKLYTPLQLSNNSAEVITGIECLQKIGDPEVLDMGNIKIKVDVEYSTLKVSVDDKIECHITTPNILNNKHLGTWMGLSVMCIGVASNSVYVDKILTDVKGRIVLLTSHHVD